jgi:hypothetical protein
MKKTTTATVEKSMSTLTKSPTLNLIPLPTAIVTIAFCQLPPGNIAPGIGVIISYTSASTTLPMYVPIMKELTIHLIELE